MRAAMTEDNVELTREGLPALAVGDSAFTAARDWRGAWTRAAIAEPVVTYAVREALGQATLRRGAS